MEALVATVAVEGSVEGVEVDRRVGHLGACVADRALALALEDVQAIGLVLSQGRLVAGQVLVHRRLVGDQCALVGLDRLAPVRREGILECRVRIRRAEGRPGQVTVAGVQTVATGAGQRAEDAVFRAHLLELERLAGQHLRAQRVGAVEGAVRARHLHRVVRRTIRLRSEAGVGHIDQVAVAVVAGVAEWVEAVEVVVRAAVPEVVAVEDSVDDLGRLATGDLAVLAEYRIAGHIANVRRMARIGVDADEVGGYLACRAEPIVIGDISHRQDRLARAGDALRIEDTVVARVDGIGQSRVLTRDEVAGRASLLAVAAHLDVPEQRLAQLHGGSLVSDGPAAGGGRRYTAERSQG